MATRLNADLFECFRINIVNVRERKCVMENNSYVYQLLKQFPKENRVAFALYDGKQTIDISYSQFRSDVLKAAGFFLQRNMVGEHIAILAPNCYNWLVVFFGILASGNVAVLVNPNLPNEELFQHIQNANTTILCGSQEDADRYIADGIFPWLSFEQVMTGNAVCLEEVAQMAPENTIVLMATSGTMGNSKIVEFTNGNVMAAMTNFQIVIAPMERVLLPMPFFHISGIAAAGAYLCKEGTICIGRGVRYMVQDMPKLNPSMVIAVPTMLNSILKLLRLCKSEEDLRKILGTNMRRASVGGADVPTEMWHELASYGIEEQISYAMTESTGCGTHCVVNETTVGSVGKPFGSTACRIENGELLLKGPTVMKGYYKDPEETAKVLRDGWLHTGDLAKIDENGNYYLIGRKKNVIILSNGENVNPEEVEARFYQCSAISECMVYGDGKGICADIYAPTGKEQAEEFIVAYNRSVPMYRQVYRRNYTTEPLEKTGSGKIKRKENR